MTLLEILVTVLILGALVVMVISIFQSALGMRQSVADHISLVDRAFGAMELIVKDLHNVHAYDSRTYFLVENKQLGGERGTSIAFPTASPVRVSEHLRERPGLIEIAYLIGEDPKSSGRLWLFRRELEPEINVAAREIRGREDGLILLVDGLKTFRMEFLSPEVILTPDGVSPDDWQDTWDGGFGKDMLPAAVHITMTVVAGPGSAGEMTLERTVRIPVADLAQYTHEELFKESLGL